MNLFLLARRVVARRLATLRITHVTESSCTLQRMVSSRGVLVMFHFESGSALLGHLHDGELFRPLSTDDNLTRPSSANLAALRRTDLTVGLRRQVGPQNMRTFPESAPDISASKPKLIAHHVVEPYVGYLRDSGQLADRRAVDTVTNIVSQLGKPALAQHQGSPQQYVSHGFDHSNRVAGYIRKIVDAYPEIEEAAAKKYKISRELARFLFQTLAHWHDIGYPDLKSRPKSTHGLSSASRFDDIRDQLGSLIRRESGRVDEALSDMRKAIQLHSADVDVEHYPIKVKTDRGSLLTSDVDSMGRLLDHYSGSSRRPHRVLEIDIRGTHAKEIEKQANDVLKSRPLEHPIKVTADDGKSDYAGRPASLDSNNEVKVGLRYTEQELTENPFAVIRLADNLDMAEDRLSPLQQSAVFRAIYWKLGDRGPIGQALSELGKLDGANTSEVPVILRKLRGAVAASKSLDIDTSILFDVARQVTPNAIYGLNAAAASRLLVRVTTDSVLRSPIARSLSQAERASLREIGYRLHGESLCHFGGCEAIASVEIKRGKVVVTVNEPVYRKSNQLTDSAGVGIGEYQIERARRAFASLTINGKRPVIEVVERNAGQV
jgi:hypothetical protein